AANSVVICFILSRFESLKEGTWKENPDEITKQLQAGKSGFVRFYLKNGAKIKKEQIPFIPDYNNNIQPQVKGRLLLYTRCVDPFLDYCQKLRQAEETSREGKIVAVRHLAILRLYNLYRLFDPQKIIAIRGDEIYVQGELPAKLNQALFHCQFINRLTVRGNTIFNHDNKELKAFTNNPQEREKLIRSFE
ncbi:1940_t:CDS:2, partial [Cetraspora pellucida]